MSGGHEALSLRRQQLVGRRAAATLRSGACVSVSEMLTAEARGLTVGPDRLAPSRAETVAGGTLRMPPPPPRGPSVRMLASALGLTGPMEGETRDHWCATPSQAEFACLEGLRAGADARMHTAHGSASGAASHLGTALRWMKRFVEALPSRRLFVRHEGAGDVHAAAYNEETFRLFAEFVRRHGSVRPGARGAVVSAATISDYVSALRAFRSREVGYNLLVAGGNLRLPLQMRQMRREDGPAGQRELSRGLTSRILRRLCTGASSFDRGHTRYAVMRWAILWGGHNLLLRGGEFGTVEGKLFVPAAGLVIADLDWVEPCAETGCYYAVVVDVLPIKDERVSRSRVPILIRRRLRWTASSQVGDDPKCAYDALWAWWRIRVREVPPHLRGTAPFFADVEGAAVRTSQVATVVRDVTF